MIPHEFEPKKKLSRDIPNTFQSNKPFIQSFNQSINRMSSIALHRILNQSINQSIDQDLHQIPVWSSGRILQHFGVFQRLAVTNIGDIHPLHAHPLIQASIELGPVDVVLVNTVSVLLHRQHLRRVVFVLLDHEHHQMGSLRGHGDFAVVRVEGNDGLRSPGVGVHDFLWRGWVAISSSPSVEISGNPSGWDSFFKES